MRAFLKTSVLLLILFILYSLLIKTIQAQGASLNITISPSFFEYNVQNNKIITDKLRLRNNLATEVKLKINIRKISADQEGNLTIETDTSDNHLRWLTFEQSEYSAPAMEWIDIPFTLKIPNEAAHGYYLAISIAGESINNRGNSIELTGMAIAPILINVQKEGTKSDAHLVEFTTKKFINEYLPVEFITKIKNVGNLHIRPRGNIFISGQGNKDLALIEVNENAGAILPNALRIFENQWSDGFLVNVLVTDNGEIIPDADGNPKRKLAIKWDKLTQFRFGPYTANIFLVFDDGKRDITLEGSTTFWIIPYTQIFILLLVILILFALIKVILKLHDRRVIERFKKSQK